MRKHNAEVRTKFISEAGADLENRDYFAFVELDDFAIYCLADGIDQISEAGRHSAQLAVQTIIEQFTARPGMGKGAIKRYFKQANQILRQQSSERHRMASVTVVVTNYVKMRIAYCGNTRCQWYRGVRRLYSSNDHSLTRMMADGGGIAKDKLAMHEERHNLYRYLGQEHWQGVEISKKYKLADNDAILLFTPGIWENLDQGEIDDAMSGADPQEILDGMEDLLLSRQPQGLANYTAALIFIDKVFRDPKKKQKIKRIVMTLIPILLILLVFGMIFYFQHTKKMNNIAQMETHYLNTIEYVQDENFVTAQEECKKAYDLAVKVKNEEIKEDCAEYTKLLEAILKADGLMEKGSYQEALDGYLRAKSRSRYSDNLASAYLDRQLVKAAQHTQVMDYLHLGDLQKEAGNLAGAEEKYNAARNLAGQIYFADGKKQAMDALEQLYGDQEAAQAEQAATDAAKAEDEVSAVTMINQGNQALAVQDYEGAKLFYLTAQEKYIMLEMPEEAARLDEKIAVIDAAIAQKTEKQNQAAEYEAKGDDSYDKGDYLQASKAYLIARDIYSELNDITRLNILQNKIDLSKEAAGPEAMSALKEETQDAEPPAAQNHENDAEDGSASEASADDAASTD